MSINSSPKPTFDTDQDEVVDIRKYLFKLLSYWHYFALTLVIAIICAWFYNRYTMPVYRVSSVLLIDEDKQSGALGTDKLLQGFGLRPGMQNLDNQIHILSSRSLIGRTLDSLHFGTEYYSRGKINKLMLYPKHPVTVIEEKPGVLPSDIEFELKYLGNNKFTLSTEEEGSYSLKKDALFDERIEFNGGSFHIKCDSIGWFTKDKSELYFIRSRRESLQESYRKRIKVEPASRDATIVVLSLVGRNKEMDIDFLNKLSDVFLNYNLDKKNTEANRTIEFIDKQLIGISDSLKITEGALQTFRSKNMVMNLSAQGQVIIEQAMKLENDKARLVIESNYYNYLAEYLSKDNIGEVPIAPATMGITDAGLTKLVMDLTAVQSQYYSKSLGDMNPMLSQMAQRLKNTKDALKETLNGVMRSNELAINENAEQIRVVNAKASALPLTERELLGIERQFKLNDVLYTFLLEKKSEAQIQKASNTPDNEIIDSATPDLSPVSPRKTLSYLIALMIGFGLPVIWIFLVDFISFKVKDEDDILKITDLPIAAQIPHSNHQSATVVFEEAYSDTAEAFRTLRSKMQFFIKENKSPVILITSSMPSEGKTFTSINLASAYSLMGMRTVLLGFDLRKPRLFDSFGVNNEKGISTWLIGKDNLDDIITDTEHKNLSLIPAGPIPPNPSELTSSAKTAELFSLLKKRFDYIIIDSPPIGVVSDTFHLATLADTCLLIVRQNKTLKYLLEKTVKDLQLSNLNKISIVINDIIVNGKGYGSRYGYGNGYGYGYGYSNAYNNGKKIHPSKVQGIKVKLKNV